MAFWHRRMGVDRPKAMFYFYSPLQTVFSSPTVDDTTPVTTTSTFRTTAKTYNLTLPTGANRIRVIIYGNVFTSTNAMTVWLNIDGTDVAQATTSSVSETLVLDYVGSIAPGSRTIRIDFMSYTGGTVRITRVYIATGIGVTSTTPVDILQFSVTYQLLRSGDVSYSPGIRVFVFGNRRTTAPLSLTIPEATGIIIGRNNLGARNDNDAGEVFLAIITGSVTLRVGGEFSLSATLRGNVGASGDTVIITRVLARAQLRREIDAVGDVRVYERGTVEYFARSVLVSVPGGLPGAGHVVSRRDLLDRHLAWITISGSGTDITLLNYKVSVVAPVHFSTSASADGAGESFLEWVQVVVWG